MIQEKKSITRISTYDTGKTYITQVATYMIQEKERNSNSYNENKKFIHRTKISTEDSSFSLRGRLRFCRYELAGVGGGADDNTSSFEYSVKKD